MSKQKHSRSYHRYFENYAEKEVLSPQGGYTIQRVYVGKYYKVDLPDDALRRQKRQIGVLYLLCLAGYILGALLSRVSAVSFVAVLTMPPLVALLFFTVAVFYRLTAPREMEIRAWRDSAQNLRTGAMAFLVCISVCFLATLIGCLAIPAYSLPETLPSLLCYLLAGAGAGQIYRIEKHTHYLILDPKQERPTESSPIRYEMPE